MLDVWPFVERGGAGHDVSDEARDERGRWVDGGDSISFISPNVSTLTFAEAVHALDGDRQKLVAAASAEIDEKLGIKSVNHPAIGAWSDGAENSLMVIAPGASTAQIRVASAMKGYIADQKAVLVFHPDVKGNDFLASFDVDGKATGIHEKLLKDGLSFHTLQPVGEGRYRVHVYGSDDATIDAVDKASEKFDAVPEFIAGSGEFIGTTKQDGTDREQRDDARQAYDRVIHDAAVSGAVEGQDVGKIWDEVRDHWSAAEASGKSRHPGPGYSASARLINGVIYTASVYDAQRALFENKRVDLKQLKQVSTLIKRLGETAAEMAEHGASAPVFNLCNVSVEGTNIFCSGHKGIPRAEMPVIPAKRTKEFIKYLIGRGYKVEKGNEEARNLRATQSEISGAKVAAAMARIKKDGFYKRLVVSRDDYVLDGHHTWAGQLGLDAKAGNLEDDNRSVKVARVDIPIIKLIAEAEKFTGGKGKKPASEAAKGYTQITIRDASALLPPALFARYYGAACEFFAANSHIDRDIDELMIVVRDYELKRDASSSLYVRRDLQNVNAFTAWAQAQGFAEVADDLHVTVLYSKTPVDWAEMGRDANGLVVAPGGVRGLEKLGPDKEAVTLRFENDELAGRHDEMVEAGASHDYDSYEPHVTINLSGTIPANATPYMGELVFGPEIFEKIDSTKEFDPNEPRDDQGRWTDGGDGESSGGAAGNYGLVPGDDKKFEALKAEWAKLNNELLEYVDKPDGPEATSRLFQLEAIVKDMHALHADPGGPAGIGLPGGPRDVLIVGAGPGGLAASINGAAEGLDTLVVEANLVAGGQAKFSSRIENFPGFPIGVTGQKLTQNMFIQAQRLGAEAKLGIRVTGMTVDSSTGLKHVELSNGEKVDARAVILAGGLEFRKLPPFPGSEGPGLIYGDGEQLKNEGKGGSVVVVGGSNGAAQAALGASQQCDHVYVLSRSPIVNGMSAYQISALKNNSKITVIESDSIAKLWRDEHGEPKTLETRGGLKLPAKAVGIFAGSVPETKWVPAEVSREKGSNRIHTNSDLGTEIPGVFAIGDMREGAIGRVGVAVGEGQIALRHANVFLAEQQEAAGIKPKAYRRKAAAKTSDELIAELFDLDRANPWFGQTVEGVTPLTPKKSFKFDPNEPRDDAGKWTSGSDDELGSMALGGEDRHITVSTQKVDALRGEMGVIEDDVPFEQRQALDMYTQNSSDFNQRARLGPGADAPETQHLDKLVGSYKLPEDVTVYRTVGWQRTKNILDHVGDSFSDPGFMSTTLDKSKIDKPGSYIEIQVPKDSHAFPVGSLSNYPEEAEILFPRNSRLQIISHEPRTDNTERFVARLVP